MTVRAGNFAGLDCIMLGFDHRTHGVGTDTGSPGYAR
jgi:hypothetical protein